VYGSRQGCAYDIGCAFASTLENSSLGSRAAHLQFKLMVGAFHGHAHNRLCQVHWHPLYIKGTGHFDGEGCEHIFSSSNDVARSTRHASWFHRRQAIEEHFEHWDKDKYAALGKLIAYPFSTCLTNLYRQLHIQSLSRGAQIHRVAGNGACCY
jgi:Kyakuja-Dileera-Zisupton transposase